ncbi:hypothetical protein NST86_06535 [Bacillus sp. FSL L8-0199]|uniref:hypothetical protein n=1 Tax=Bacillus TaxID=1386 RepID=UPI000BF597D3|nr:hypothetical protein [Bacillus thuringiensis]PFA06432.1 hypothetical protein CN379_15315 [Bacillus thuringiensis]PFU01386.1 hypothetical protein COK75_17730 [Bacillus thuringiensis]
MKYYYIEGQIELRIDKRGNIVFSPITGMYAKGKSVGEMLDSYDLEIIPSNKKIKEEMGITEEDMSRFSFPKIIRKKLVKDCRPIQVKENKKLIS